VFIKNNETCVLAQPLVGMLSYIGFRTVKSAKLGTFEEDERSMGILHWKYPL
jgi:hypothetical protein